MFFQVLANRLLTFMVGNGYIDQSIQKGFLPGVAGCVEHTQVLMETLLDAKRNLREIVVAWLDLANAYGSVAHNLIQFALEWYHVPANIRELIYHYYDELFVRVKTKQWNSDWFMFQIGLFQGCPLSVVLFLIVFNLLLDLLKTKQHLVKKHRDPAATEGICRWPDPHCKEWTRLRGTGISSGDFPQLDPNNEGQALQMQKSSHEEDTVG